MSLSTVQVFQTNRFSRSYKKLHLKQKAEVDQAVAAIVQDPTLGEAKKCDLAGVFFYRFTYNDQLTLLAFEYDPKTRLLLLLGSYENFYRNLER
ncbi:MAG: addiction module toxin RelE [Alcaligenaceae bacterium]|nr:MAG: addiction module toxin RelE [Alcaligenaceae bacterium]